MSNPKPHRRMTLTQSTLPPASPKPKPKPVAEVSKAMVSDAPGPVADNVVRVMAYLAPDEAEVLDEIWMRTRRLPTRPSKSDILRAALLLAAEKEEVLTDVLSQQRTNTLSRQRARKSRTSVRTG